MAKKTTKRGGVAKKSKKYILRAKKGRMPIFLGTSKKKALARLAAIMIKVKNGVQWPGKATKEASA